MLCLRHTTKNIQETPFVIYLYGPGREKTGMDGLAAQPLNKMNVTVGETFLPPYIASLLLAGPLSCHSRNGPVAQSRRTA